eukprot:sb/3461646/
MKFKGPVYKFKSTLGCHLALRSSQKEMAQRLKWEPWQTPRNLLLALIGEMGELLEDALQNETCTPPNDGHELLDKSRVPRGKGTKKGDEKTPDADEESSPDFGKILNELDDVFSYLISLAQECHVDLGALDLPRDDKLNQPCFTKTSWDELEVTAFFYAIPPLPSEQSNLLREGLSMCSIASTISSIMWPMTVGVGLGNVSKEIQQQTDRAVKDLFCHLIVLSSRYEYDLPIRLRVKHAKTALKYGGRDGLTSKTTRETAAESKYADTPNFSLSGETTQDYELRTPVKIESVERALGHLIISLGNMAESVQWCSDGTEINWSDERRAQLAHQLALAIRYTCGIAQNHDVDLGDAMSCDKRLARIVSESENTDSDKTGPNNTDSDKNSVDSGQEDVVSKDNESKENGSSKQCRTIRDVEMIFMGFVGTGDKFYSPRNVILKLFSLTGDIIRTNQKGRSNVKKELDLERIFCRVEQSGKTGRFPAPRRVEPKQTMLKNCDPTVEALRSSQKEMAQRLKWEPWQTPRNLLLALIGEMGELLEDALQNETCTPPNDGHELLDKSRVLRGKGTKKGDEKTPEDADESPPDFGKILNELDDVFSYLISLAQECHVDLGVLDLPRDDKLDQPCFTKTSWDELEVTAFFYAIPPLPSEQSNLLQECLSMCSIAANISSIMWPTTVDVGLGNVSKEIQQQTDRAVKDLFCHLIVLSSRYEYDLPIRLRVKHAKTALKYGGKDGLTSKTTRETAAESNYADTPNFSVSGETTQDYELRTPVTIESVERALGQLIISLGNMAESVQWCSDGTEIQWSDERRAQLAHQVALSIQYTCGIAKNHDVDLGDAMSCDKRLARIISENENTDSDKTGPNKADSGQEDVVTEDNNKDDEKKENGSAKHCRTIRDVETIFMGFVGTGDKFNSPRNVILKLFSLTGDIIRMYQKGRSNVKKELDLEQSRDKTEGTKMISVLKLVGVGAKIKSLSHLVN